MDKRQSFYMFGGQSSTNVLQQKIQAAREGVTSEPELDEDQEKKYAEIIDVLLAGGYFRARITGLSRFDKVVGGMAWCITSSNADLDVDLFFQEEASIGQKIKLAENIIRALQRMKCPYRLDPQQLQGGANTSDFINIYPVIQWLVKKVIETREETGDLMRMYSESQFAKEHRLPQESELFAKKTDAIAFLGKVADRYRPTRKFKKHGRRVFYATNKSEYERIQLALLEYGDITVSKGSQKDDEDKNDDDASNLRKEMSQYVSSGRVNQDVLGNLIPDNIQDMESKYDTEADDGGSNTGKLFGIKLHEQNLNKLEKTIAAKMQELKKLKEAYEEITAQLEEIQSEYTAKVAYNQRIIEEIAKLDQLETPENSKQLQILKGLVALNENLKLQEQQFKQSCKKQLTEFKQKIEELQAEIPNSGKSEEDEAVLATFQKELERLSQAKQFNSKKTRDLALVERKIDEVPSRTELTQYQRQFVELYETVASKETETRQYYNTYNQCEDTKVYLSKEVSILNSIHDNYKTAMGSKAGKDQFLESLNSIIKSVNSTLEKSESKLNVEKDSKSKLSETYTALVDRERLYYKLTKDFLEECKKNEKMQSQLESYQ